MPLKAGLWAQRAPSLTQTTAACIGPTCIVIQNTRSREYFSSIARTAGPSVLAVQLSLTSDPKLKHKVPISLTAPSYGSKSTAFRKPQTFFFKELKSNETKSPLGYRFRVSRRLDCFCAGGDARTFASAKTRDEQGAKSKDHRRDRKETLGGLEKARLQAVQSLSFS